MHIYFAPLEGITTYPYRNLHHKYFGGVEKYFTPFLAPGPEQGMSMKEMRDVLPENNAGVPVVPQILTNRAGDFLLASKKLLEMVHIPFLPIPPVIDEALFGIFLSVYSAPYNFLPSQVICSLNLSQE